MPGPSDGPRVAGRRRAGLLALALLLAVGFGLRLWFASWGLHSGRFWDERYSLLNIERLLRDGELEPASGYYPSPVWSVPPATLLALGERLGSAPMLLKAGHASARGRLLLRGYTCLLGSACVLLVWLLGRHGFGSAAGWVAALLVCLMPWMVYVSAYFKPDALLCACVLAAALAGSRLAERPSPANALLTALALALAMSAKLPGGLVAVAVSAAVLVAPRAQLGGRLAWLTLTALASALGFVALNPHWRSYGHYLELIRRDYARKSAAVEPGPASQLLGFLTDRLALGLLPGVAALLGLLLLALALLRGRGPWRERRLAALLLVYLLLYPLAFRLQTPYFKGNNFVSLLPFAALAAGWLAARLWQRLETRRPRLRRPGARLAALLALAAALTPGAWLYVYRSLTPTSSDRARALLRRELAGGRGRVALVEPTGAPDPPWEGRQAAPAWRGIAVVEVGRLASLPAERLELADALWFRRARLTGSQHRSYRRLLESPHSRKLEIGPRAFKVRGPPLVLLLRPWRPDGDPLELGVDDCRQPGVCASLALPKPTRPSQPHSLFVWIPDRRLVPGLEPSLELPDRRLPLHWSRRQGHGQLFASERFRLSAGRRLRLLGLRQTPQAAPPVAVELWRWRAPGLGAP